VGVLAADRKGGRSPSEGRFAWPPSP